MKYKHLYRNKWLKIKPAKYTSIWYDDEKVQNFEDVHFDKMLKDFTKTWYINEIVISERRPD